MSADTHDTDPAEVLLAELAGLDMTLARHLHACAMAHDDPEVVSGVARAYQRVARSARMTLALLTRLKRERLRGGAPSVTPPDALPGAPPMPDPAAEAADQRRRDLRTAVRRIVWAEREREADHEGEAPEVLLERVERRLARRDAAFGRVLRDGAWEELPLDEHVVRLCRMAGLPDEAALAWRDLPDPPDDALPRRLRESSA